jgi:hypothetical protein
MLSEDEIKEFLAMLLAFCGHTNTSARGLAKLFSVTPNTAARWLRAARGKGGVERMIYVRTDPIKRTILSANIHDTKNASYRRIAGIEDQGKRLVELAKLLKAQ